MSLVKIIDDVRIPYVMPSKNAKELIDWWDKNMANNANEEIPEKLFFPKSRSEKENSEDALALFRHVAEDVLVVNPYEFSNMLSVELLDDFHLKKAFSKVCYPKILANRANNVWYIANVCYPDILPLPKTQLIITEYMSVLYSGNRTRSRFLSGEPTEEKRQAATLCLHHYLASHRTEKMNDLYETYLFFADRPQAMKFLKRGALDCACNSLFPSPLAFFHESLPASERSDLYFQLASFLFDAGELPNIGKKRRGGNCVR